MRRDLTTRSIILEMRDRFEIGDIADGYAGGVGQNRRLSTNNRLYLENGTR